MKRTAILLALLGVVAGQQVLADDDGAGKKSGKDFGIGNIEKGLQSVGQGITKGARESGIESGVRAAGNGVKNAVKHAGNATRKSGGKPKQGEK